MDAVKQVLDALKLEKDTHDYILSVLHERPIVAQVLVATCYNNEEFTRYATETFNKNGVKVESKHVIELRIGLMNKESPSAKRARTDDSEVAKLDVGHHELNIEKERIIQTLERVIQEKDKMIAEKEKRIKDLQTEIAYKEGELNCRGILERFERKACPRYVLNSYTRTARWCYIFTQQPRLFQQIKETIGQGEGEDEAKTAESIRQLYEYLSGKIHESTPRCLIIHDSLSMTDHVILAVLCNALSINWQSNKIHYDLSPNVINRHHMK